MNKLLLILISVVLSGCTASIGTPPSSTTYTTSVPTTTHTTYTTPVAETTTVTHY